MELDHDQTRQLAEAMLRAYPRRSQLAALAAALGAAPDMASRPPGLLETASDLVVWIAQTDKLAALITQAAQAGPAGLDLQACAATLRERQVEPGPDVRTNYLRWLVERNSILDPRGTMQTQRQVQLKLNDIFVTLQAQPDDLPPDHDTRALREQLEREGDVERLAELWDRPAKLRATAGAPVPQAAPVSLADVAAQHNRVVILGDPGGGKTTLLRYLALKHAQAQLAGAASAGQTNSGADLGPARFPIMIRIADYAEARAWRTTPLAGFFATAYHHSGCTVDGLEALLASELRLGGCLILLDGLDEVVSSADRQAVVGCIEDFVAQYGGANRIVVSSRVAGYRAAPLTSGFRHYMIREMDTPLIRLFLEQWCRAVEDAETPDLLPETRAQKATEEITAIMAAVEKNPGVRRLATNPLLLRTLALIHRTGARLPQKRIELYHLAADTLGRTWRTAQGVPESALVKDEFLTPMLARLAFWLHENKPTGIASEREVYSVLGAEWARLKGLPWDPNMQPPEITEEVGRFLAQVREQTGLLMERAPRRYGFMHLTFEEYYAARALLTRPRNSARLIREHLHHPRWDEPILLALGYVGVYGSFDAAAELLESAILARGEEAEDLNFKPSPDEDLLARDYLFALRCLADDIPMRPALLRELMTRLAGELLRRAGLAKYTRYRKEVEELLLGLNDTSAGHSLEPLFIKGLEGETKERRNAAFSLGWLGQSSPEIVAVLIDALHNDDIYVRIHAANSLGRLGQGNPEVVAVLIDALHNDDGDLRRFAADILGELGQGSPEVVAALREALHNDSYVRLSAAESLGELGRGSPDALAALLEGLHDGDSDVRFTAVDRLGELGYGSPEVVAALFQILHHDSDVHLAAAFRLGGLGRSNPEVVAALLQALRDDDSEVRYSVANTLDELGQGSPEVVAALLEALRDKASDVRYSAAISLGRLGQGSPEVVAALREALNDDDSDVRRFAAYGLARLGQNSPEVVAALLQALRSDDIYARSYAATSLGELGQGSPEVVAALREALHDGEIAVRRPAADSVGLIGQIGPPGAALNASPPTLITVLENGLVDEDNGVRTACVRALVRLASRFPAAEALINSLLHEALDDPRFDPPDRYQKRSGHDYAYDGLWMLANGEELEEKE